MFQYDISSEVALTLRSKVLGSLQVVHLLQRFRLFLRELLLIIVLPGSCYAIEEHAALLCVAEVVHDGEDKEAEACSAEYREHANHDTLRSRTQAIVVVTCYPYSVAGRCVHGVCSLSEHCSCRS